MNDEIEFPAGFRVGDQEVRDWTQHLAISREVQPDGDEWCVVWIGTFDLIMSESGGWQPEDGAALGVRLDGSTVLDPNWREHLAEDVEVSELRTPRYPLAKALWFAVHIAATASGFLPAVDDAFERGATFEQLIAVVGVHLDEMLMREYPDNPALWQNQAELSYIALGLLWVSEEIRRDQASAV